MTHLRLYNSQWVQSQKPQTLTPRPRITRSPDAPTSGRPGRGRAAHAQSDPQATGPGPWVPQPVPTLPLWTRVAKEKTRQTRKAVRQATMARSRRRGPEEHS